MKNEVDIVESTVRHLLKQGVDGVFVADHSSTDGTAEALVELGQREAVAAYRLELDGFFQEETMMTLATIARRAGAKWIIPFDADEYWFAESGPLGVFLRSQTCTKVYAEGCNIFPTQSAVDVPVWTQGKLDFGTTGYRKVSYRSSRFAYVHHGNHSVLRRGDSFPGLKIAHAPIRNVDQLRRKVRQGVAGIRAAGIDRGKHWQQLDQLSDTDLEGYWAALTDLAPQGTSSKLTGPFTPIGPFATVRIEEASDWRELLGAAVRRG